MAFIVAHLVLESPFGAGLAALAFALTPKAPSIAVLWISARGELLVALFSLASIAAWIMWTRRGRAWWLAAALAAYGLALLSKETATLLPVLLLLTKRSERPLAARTAAVTGFIVLALVIYAWRSQTGALTPFAGDEHYSPGDLRRTVAAQRDQLRRTNDCGAARIARDSRPRALFIFP